MENGSERRVKVGVVGCGVVATAYYLPYLMRHADLVAVCDLDERRTAACARLYGVKEQYQDYDEMIQRADIEAVFILTGPAPHVRFALTAVEAGKHILIQKPMALTLAECDQIVEAVRAADVKAIIEPSANSPLDPSYASLRALLDKGVLGDPYWFSLIPGTFDHYHPGLGGNPYGNKAFFTADSGGMLFDFPYAPTQLVTLLGPCKSVMGMAKISAPKRMIVPDGRYDAFLDRATDPDDANYWDAVLDEPKTETVTMGAPDNVYSLYEMESGAIGVFHVGRPFHPVLPGTRRSSLDIFGTEGNCILGMGHFASVISEHKNLLPQVADDGWYHMPVVGDPSKGKWPQPTPGGFNYYHRSSQHLIDCILKNRDPVVNVEWGRHITEMMIGAIESSDKGVRYEMTTHPVRKQP